MCTRIEKKNDGRIRVFFDMDGALADYAAVVEEDWYREGYYISLKPQMAIVQALRDMIREYGDSIECFSLSACLPQVPFAEVEKNDWLDKYVPELDEEHRIFVPVGTKKSDFVGGTTMEDILIDDYSKNCNEWEAAGGRAIKVLNGRNGKGVAFLGERFSIARSEKELIEMILHGEEPEEE